MKDPKALFPFLFASSWLGNLLLTILAFYLAFSHEGPLTPLVFLTVALCILSGNALPIGVYLILVRWRADELKAESAEATLRVRDALARSEEVMARLDEAEGALAKSTLVARQVPERIKASFEQVDQLAEKLETLELNSFTEALVRQEQAVKDLGQPLEAIKTDADSVNTALTALKKDVKGVPAALEKILAEVAASTRAEGESEADVSAMERLDLVFETLEGIQDSLDGLLQRMAELKAAAPEPQPEPQPEPEEAEPEEAEKEPEEKDQPEPVEETPEREEEVEEEEAPEPEPEPEEEDEPETAGEPALVEEESDQSEAEAPSEEPGPEPEPEKKPAKKAARKASKPKKPPEEQMMLSDDLGPAKPEAEREDSTGEDSFAPDGKTRLFAHAMIGMANKLYIRGDEPWLSWDDGQQMELIGIGEFSWSIEDLKEPMEVTLFLNDELAAEGKPITLEPGKTVRVNPKFPQQDPF
ncbi:MAG: hypothetical protein AB3N33_07745 [Puniceicoccaceae bacterium]